MPRRLANRDKTVATLEAKLKDILKKHDIVEGREEIITIFKDSIASIKPEGFRTKPITITGKKVVLPKASGIVPGRKGRKCPTCNGTGRI